MCFFGRVAKAQVYNINFNEVDISSLTYIVGTGSGAGTVGAQYHRVNAVGTIDLLLTIDARVNVSDFILDNDGSNTARFQPEINSSGGVSYVDFRFEFFEDYTDPATKVDVIDFWVTFIDLDGATTYQEYTEVQGFSTYEVDASSGLTLQPGSRTGFTRIRGLNSTLAGLTFDDTASALVEYSSVLGQFDLRLGLTGTNSSRRLFSIAVGSRTGFVFSNPITTTSSAFPTFPDLGTAFTNIVKTGDVSVNDNVNPAITSYSTPIADGGNPAGASITLNADGTYEFLATNPGIYRYDYSVCTAATPTPSCNSQSLTITVLDATVDTNNPVANNDFALTELNTLVNINVLSNDDVGNNGNTLAAGPPTGNVTIASAPIVGTAVVQADGTINYTPNTGFTGLDFFTYEITDSEGNTATATVFVRTYLDTGGNVVVATDDFNYLLQGQTASDNALANDAQFDTTIPLSVVGGPTILTDAFGNELSIAANGAYTFTPDDFFSGTTSFEYTTTGTLGETASATIHFNVAPFQQFPDFGSGFVNLAVNGDVNINDNVVGGTTYNSATLSSSPGGSSPSLTFNADGTYTFTGDVAGTYVYTFDVCAPSAPTPPCEASQLTITLSDPSGSANPPYANSDNAATEEGVAVVIGVLDNDLPGNPGNNLVPGSVSVTATPSNGGTSINPATGDITYTPNPGFTGTDTFTYQVCDDSTPTALCSTATVQVIVFPTTAPVFIITNNDFNSTFLNESVSGNLLDNDFVSDASGGLDVQGTLPLTLTDASGNTLVINSGGGYTFTPAFGFTGNTSFEYTAEKTGSAPASATAYFTVRAGLLPQPDVASAFVNESISGDANTNDDVVAGSTYSATLASAPGAAAISFTMNADGTYTFETDTPGVYVYDVEVCAPTTPPACETRTLIITVTNPASATNPPVAHTDLATTEEGTAVIINVLANDQPGVPDDAGKALAPPPGSISAPANGNAVLSGNNIQYTPNPGFTGTDSFTYQICDAAAVCATATVFVDVYPTSSGNVVLASDDYGAGTFQTGITGNLLDNDSQLDGTDALDIPAPGTFPITGGSLTIAADGTYTFVPNPGFTGTTSYVYETEGTSGATASATLYLSIYPDMLVKPDVAVAETDQTITGDLGTNDAVPSLTTYTLDATVSTPGGATTTFTVNLDGTFSFVTDTPGIYVYNIEACAPTTPPGCEIKTFTITVTNPGVTTNPPVANNDVATTYADANPANPGAPVAIVVAANDAPGNNGGTLDLTDVNVTTGPANGITSVNPVTGVITYTPDAGFTGIDSFTYTIDDTDANGPTTATVFVTVYPASTANIVFANDDFATTGANLPVSGNVLTNDTQLSGAALTTVTTTGTFSNAGEGSLLLNADGTFTFTPVSGFEGSTSFTYTAEGTDGATASATLHILVQPPLEYTWLGTNSDWCDPTNWDRGAIPTTAANVIIASTATDPSFDGTCPVCVNNLTIASGASLDLSAGLCVTGDLVSDGPVTGAGSIILQGTAPQTITGEFNINNLELDNPTGATITAGAGNMVNITESIKLSNGTLTTNDNLRLVSDASGDAYFAPISSAECALVGIIGNVRVQKFVDGGNRAFRFIAHPFDGTISLQQIRDYVHITGEGLDFNDTGNPSAFWYNTTSGNQAEEGEDTGWTAVTSSTLGDWTKGRAVRMLFRGPRTQAGVVGDDDYVANDVTYELIGPVNICDQTLTGLRRVGSPGTGGAGNSAFNFIGNPYPAAVNLKTIPGTSRADVGNDYYLWQPRTGVASGDIVFGPGGGRGGSYFAEPFDSGPAERGQLASGTGFFVTANVDGASIIFTEANKLAQKALDAGSAVTFREDNRYSSSYGANSMQLEVKINEELIDRVLLFFTDDAEARLEARDAGKFENPLINFFTLSEDGYALAIDRRPWADNFRIPLHILSPATSFTLEVPDLDIPADQQAYLHDRYLDEMTLLERGTSYTFNITEEPTSKGHRFDIVMGKEVVTSLDKSANGLQVFLLPNPAEQHLAITINRPVQDLDTQVRVIDMQGIILFSAILPMNQEDGRIHYEVNTLPKGMYLVEVQQGKNRQVKKLIIK